MKYFAAGLFLFISLPCNAQNSGKDETVFIKLQQEWAEARKTRNIPFLEKLMAPRIHGNKISRCSPPAI